jgi:hypothetical protein
MMRIQLDHDPDLGPTLEKRPFFKISENRKTKVGMLGNMNAGCGEEWMGKD